MGVAGGLKDVQIGDVVAATKVYGYESGKDLEAFQTRAEIGRSSHRLEQRARAEARKSDWVQRVPETHRGVIPRVFVEPIAAGEKVIASNRSPTYQFLRASFSDAVAVEMEGIGFLQAAHANETPALVIRGVSDLIEGKAEADSSGSQELAAQYASAFAFELLSKLTQRSHKGARDKAQTLEGGSGGFATVTPLSVSDNPLVNIPNVPFWGSGPNPYTAPLPVMGPDQLYGRKDILVRLFNGLLDNKRPISQQVVGLTRSGKTSILNVLSHGHLRQYLVRFGLSKDIDTRLLFVRLDCGLLSSNEPSEFWGLVQRQLLGALQLKSPGRAKELPAGQGPTVHHVAESMDKLRSMGLLAVFLMDEFDRVILQLPEDVFSQLRSLLETHLNMACVTATRHDLFLLFDLVRPGLGPYARSPFFNVFDAPVGLGGLDIEGTISFIREPSSACGVSFSEEDVRFILELGGRHPDLTRVVCRRLFDYRESHPEGTPDYKLVRQQVVSDFLPSAKQMVAELLPVERATFRRVLSGTCDPREDYYPLHLLGELGLVSSSNGSLRAFSPILEDMIEYLTFDT